MSEHVQPLEAVRSAGTSQETQKVIFASSLGTVFEWYDFFLYGALAAVISKQFFAGFADRPKLCQMMLPKNLLTKIYLPTKQSLIP